MSTCQQNPTVEPAFGDDVTLPDLTALLPPATRPRVIRADQWRGLADLCSDLARAREALNLAVRRQHARLEAEADDIRQTVREEEQARCADELLGLTEELRTAAAEQHKALVGLMFHALEHVLGDVAPTLIPAHLAKRALETQVDKEVAVTVRVHPEALADVTRVLADRVGPVDIEADATLAPDDCDIDTPHATLRAGLQVQLAALRRRMLAACDKVSA